MPAQIYFYTKIVEPGPNGRSLVARLPEGGIELCTLDGLTYISIPAEATLPEQHSEIALEPVALDAALRERINAESRPCQLIAETMRQRIRSQYSLDDELYFARIAVGALQGTYELRPGELDLLARYQSDVEAAREDAHMERLALGL